MSKTYKHLIAGSTVITPSGKTLRFMGKPGSIGFYTTDDAGEIELLDQLHKAPTAQVERIEDETAVTEEITKPVDPALAAAVHDAAENSERTADPAVSAAQENLAKLIAAKK